MSGQFLRWGTVKRIWNFGPKWDTSLTPWGTDPLPFLKELCCWWPPPWSWWTTSCPWSCCPHGNFFGLLDGGGSSQDILTISTFLLQHSFMLKSYRWGGWNFSVSPSPLDWGFGTRGLGLGIDNNGEHYYNWLIFVIGWWCLILSRV